MAVQMEYEKDVKVAALNERKIADRLWFIHMRACTKLA